MNNQRLWMPMNANEYLASFIKDTRTRTQEYWVFSCCHKIRRGNTVRYAVLLSMILLFDWMHVVKNVWTVLSLSFNGNSDAEMASKLHSEHKSKRNECECDVNGYVWVCMCVFAATLTMKYAHKHMYSYKWRIRASYERFIYLFLNIFSGHALLRWISCSSLRSCSCKCVLTESGITWE